MKMLWKRSRKQTSYLYLLAAWFFLGMPVNILLSSFYTFINAPQPALLFFLSSFVYLNGGLLGAIWSKKNLQQRTKQNWNLLGSLLLLFASAGFLCLSIFFAIKGLQRF